MPRAVEPGTLDNARLLAVEPEPEPEPEPGADDARQIGGEAEAEAAWDGAWAAGVDADVAASLARLRAEWMSQRPASSPARSHLHVDASSHTERLSVDEWCRIAKRCGLRFGGGMRRGLEGIAQRNDFRTLSYHEVERWYVTYTKRSMLLEADHGDAGGGPRTHVWCCIVGVPCCLEVPVSSVLASVVVRQTLSAVVSLFIVALGWATLHVRNAKG
jgi:hypothetical protein